MAQRKPPPPGKPAAKKGTTRPAGKPSGTAASGTKASAAKATERKNPSAGRGPATKPPARRGRSKSIVNQRQTPWGLIASATAVVVFAAVVVIVVIATHKSSSSSASDRYRLPELPAAKQITGVSYHIEPNHNHVATAVKYDTSPPTGGNHSQIWADCAGTVYTSAIANENAVHMLEHGAVWITYKPGLPATQVAKLAGLVNGVDRMAMSPYPGLKTNISLQAWGYQLFVNSASDPRVNDFIAALRFNPKTDPENASGVTCADPGFKAKPSTFGHPIFNLSG
jgi:hypothetical protein